MKWGRQIDYHGSRSYDADGPAVGRFGLIAAWLADVAASRLRRLRMSETRRTPSRIVLSKGKRGFSSLGAAPVRSPQPRAADRPFSHAAPMKSK